MKIILALSYLFLIFPLRAFPQDKAPDIHKMFKKPALERARLQTDFLKKKLNLNAFQYTKLLQINTHYAFVTDSIFNQNKTNIIRYYKMNQMDNERSKKIKPLLTKQQYENYLEYKSKLVKKFLLEED